MSEKTDVFNKKQQRFKEVAKKRTSKAIGAISHIGDIAKMPSLEPIPEDVEKIVTALQFAIDKVSERLNSEQEEKEDFTL